MIIWPLEKQQSGQGLPARFFVEVDV